MSLNDSLSDMLARIKNAHQANKVSTMCLKSKLNMNVLSVLKNEGYMSIDAKNGEDALERVKEKPDLIVLDLDMPRMDGFEFIEKTQEDGIKIPIVVFSVKDITAVEEKMLSKFTEGIVKKESKVDTLVQEVNQILKGENPK